MKSVLSIDEKLDMISSMELSENLSNRDEIKLKEFAFDDDPEVRYRVAELLALFPAKESEKILLNMLADRDHLVRASVCDSLSFSSSVATLETLLIVAKKDKRYLVRGYAILSIADICRNIGVGNTISKVTSCLSQLEHLEDSPWVRVALFRSMFVLGDYSCGEKLLHMLNNSAYRIRSFSIILLDEIVECGLVSKVPNMKYFLEERLKIERNNIIKQKISNVLGKI